MSAATTSRAVRKAVLPVAGLGTRFLPATKSVPKEMLPIVDRPAIQYIVEECHRAGLRDVLMVTGLGKTAIEDHFDRRPDLEDMLGRTGKDEALDAVIRVAELAAVHTVRQPEPLGLGHAVLMAEHHVGDEPFAVLLGDDIVHPDEPFLERMLAAHERTGRSVVGLMEVPHDQVHRYGVASVDPTGEDGEFEITGLVEKPPLDRAPSNLIVIGRYVLAPPIFDVLHGTGTGAGGEIQLTDALQTLAEDGPLIGIRLDGRRHDTGDRLGYLKATVEFAAEHDELGADFLAWLEGFVTRREP